MLNTVITGDCLSVLKKFEACTVDLVVTSPPYDGLRNYNGYSFAFEPIAKELTRVIKTGGVIVWVVGDATVKGSETGTSFRQALYFKDVCGLALETMIYVKNNPMPIRAKRYQPAFEYMFVLSKGTPKTFNPLTEICKYAGVVRKGKTHRAIDGSLVESRASLYNATKPLNNVWRYSVGKRNSTLDNEAFQHPAIFPEKLAEDHILTWTNPGDIVLDPFGGSGTVAKMAASNGRNFIHIDCSDKYNAIAMKRLEALNLKHMLTCEVDLS